MCTYRLVSAHFLCETSGNSYFSPAPSWRFVQNHEKSVPQTGTPLFYGFSAPSAFRLLRQNIETIYILMKFMLLLSSFPAICVTFLCHFDVNCTLMSNSHFGICSPHKFGCFPLADSLGGCTDFCKSATDKRPSNFSACYNCFFQVIPLK